jgi:hypothetical protein
MILYLSMILGVIFVLLGKLNKAKALPEFTWEKFISINMVSVLMNLVAGIALVINQAELVAVFQKVAPNFEFLTGGLFSFIIGVSGVTIVQFLADMLQRHEKTAVGVNNDKP